MSKNNKPRNSATTGRPSGGSTTPRSASTKATTGTSSPKFYDGPTVRRADKDASRAVVKQPSTSKALIPVPKKVKTRRRFGFFSLITFVPILIFCSLFSTVLCPPPTAKHATFAQSALNTLGFAKTTHPTLHETLCYPANVYRAEVLEPYVYPVLEDVQAKVQAHPFYKQNVEPRYNSAKGTALRVWNGPVKPVVNRIARGARKFYLTNIQPHLPYLRAKFTEATAPLTLRIKVLYNQYAAQHVKVAKKQLCNAWKQTKSIYRQIAAHPLTAQAGKHSQTALRLSQDQMHKAYVFSKPHAINAWNFGVHHTHHTVLPRVVVALRIFVNDVTRVFNYVKGQACALYKAHAAEHVDPSLRKAADALGPYKEAFVTRVYQPHIKPLIASILPPVVVPEKSFWSYVADWVPAAGIHVDDRGQRIFNAEKPPTPPKVEKPKDITKELPKVEKPKAEQPKEIKKEEPKVETAKAAEKERAQKPLEVSEQAKVETATEKSTMSASPSASATRVPEDKDHLTDVVAALEALKKKVDFQAKAGYSRAQGEIVKEAEHFLELLPQMGTIGTENLDREMKRMVTGLDRLYSNSKTLTRGQVAESIDMSNKKVVKQLNTARTGVQTKTNQLKDKYQPMVKAVQNELDKLVGPEYEALGKKMAIIDDVSQKEWTAYKDIKKTVDTWKAKYADLIDKPTSKQLKDLHNKVQVQAAEIVTSFDDLYESFREHQMRLKKVALDRIAAREAVAKDQKDAPIRAGGKAKKAEKADQAGSADSGRVSIQPIKGDDESGNNVRGGIPVIGKDKVQVEDALKAAQMAKEEEEKLEKQKAKITKRPEL